MNETDNRTPLRELENRHERCRALLAAMMPEAGGLLISGTSTLFYLTGTAANGVFWLPRRGKPVLAVRKGLERAGLESCLPSIVAFRSFRDLAPLFAAEGSPLTPVIAVDMAGTSWETGRMLMERLHGRTFVPAEGVLSRAKAIKSSWELARMRESGNRLYRSQRMELPERIHPGMTELAIASTLWSCCFALGHCGPQEAGMQGSGVFLGHIAAGNNGNYPSAYDGPVGLRGTHPASPFMGSADCIWEEGMLLTVDTGFNHHGYLADRTQVYFAGNERDIPEAAHKAHDAAMTLGKNAATMLRPGAIPSAIYKNILTQAEAAGFAKGFMGLGDNQVRFLGHGIGLTVSEWPIITRRSTEPLQVGMCIALEPKIGIPGVGMVGVENTFEITEDGAVSLTGDENGILCLG